MNETNAFKQKEKIIKMKLQTAKILWSEDRKEATFLILESMDDPRARADELRERMGFDEDFELGHTHRSARHSILVGIGIIILLILSFLLGTFLHPRGKQNKAIPSWLRMKR